MKKLFRKGDCKRQTLVRKLRAGSTHGNKLLQGGACKTSWMGGSHHLMDSWLLASPRTHHVFPVDLLFRKNMILGLNPFRLL